MAEWGIKTVKEAFDKYKSPTTESSIEGIRQTMKHGRIMQCISDHVSQFISNIGGDSKFKEFLDENGIQQILCRIKHPQSNGKVEKFRRVYCVVQGHKTA